MFTALALTLSLAVNPTALRLEPPALEIHRPAPSLGLPQLGLRANVDLAAAGAKRANELTAGMVVEGILGGVAIIAVTTAVLMGAMALVVYLGMELLKAALSSGPLFSGPFCMLGAEAGTLDAYRTRAMRAGRGGASGTRDVGLSWVGAQATA